MTARRGVTLIELIVVIAILGVMAGVATLGLRTVRKTDQVDVATALISATRDSALRTGRPATTAIPAAALPSGIAVLVTALPDGRVIAPRALGIDALSGRPVHAPR
jgi:prepilin-type N-terminal cleavage/methylation domain-containing protein